MEELLTPDETGQLLKKEKQTLAEWRCTKRYDLPYLKIGGRVMYLKKDVLAFLDESKHEAR